MCACGLVCRGLREPHATPPRPPDARRSLDNGDKMLRADYQVDCRGEKYEDSITTVAVGLGAYTVGIPLLYAALTYSHRAVLRTAVASRTAAQAASVQSIAFLWESCCR